MRIVGIMGVVIGFVIMLFLISFIIFCFIITGEDDYERTRKNNK